MTLLTGIIVRVGLANTQTFTWAGSTMFLQSLWSRNLIVMGLQGIVQWIATSVLGYNALSAATLTWWSVATLGIAAIVAIVGYLFFWKTDLEKAAEKTERLKKRNGKYKESLDSIADRHKKILDYMNQAREAAKTPEQKSVEREKELQDAMNEPEKLRQQTESLKKQINSLKSQLKVTKDKEEKDELQSRIAQKALKDLQKLQKDLKPLTQAEIDRQRTENLKTKIGDRGLSTYLPQETAAQEQERALKELEALKGKVSENQYAAMRENIEKTFRENDLEIKALADVAKKRE
jgi:DNA repair exonuclease SbcCD ATPase subunit